MPPWLMFGLLGSMLATFIVSRLEAELEQQLALAFFIPGLVYMADAVGRFGSCSANCAWQLPYPVLCWFREALPPRWDCCCRPY